MFRSSMITFVELHNPTEEYARWCLKKKEIYLPVYISRRFVEETT
jgi:hypothetical protein